MGKSKAICCSDELFWVGHWSCVSSYLSNLKLNIINLKSKNIPISCIIVVNTGICTGNTKWVSGLPVF